MARIEYVSMTFPLGLCIWNNCSLGRLYEIYVLAAFIGIDTYMEDIAIQISRAPLHGIMAVDRYEI